jgi:protein translocase SecG subunit
MKHILIICTAFVSMFLLGVILFQSPKQESLGNAFNGEKVYVSSLNKTLIRLTYIAVVILALLLIALKLI